jgi:putative transposase
MPETSVQRRNEALPDKSGVSMSSISLSLEAETCPEDVRFVRYSRQLCNIVGSVKAFPVQDDDHLLTVLRYVERNALRAELVCRAEDWKWSSLPGWERGDPLLWKGEAPVRDGRWLERVNEPLSAGDLQRLRHSVSRGRPYGGEAWTRETAIRLGLESCLRPQGRPRKEEV